MLDLDKYTPLERQFIDVKDAHPDVIIMVEHGYRYRFFGHDAEVCNQPSTQSSHQSPLLMRGALAHVLLDLELL